MAVGRGLATNEQVVQIRVGRQIVDRADDRRQTDPVVPANGSGRKHIALHQDPGIERRAQPRDAQKIAVVQRLRARNAGRVHRQHHPMVALIETGEHRPRTVGLRRKAAGQLDQIGNGGIPLELIDGGPAYLAVNACGRSDRRHEDHVPLEKLGIVARVAANQHVVQVQTPHQCALALQLHIAQ